MTRQVKMRWALTAAIVIVLDYIGYLIATNK